MRRIHSFGMALTLIGALGLMHPPAAAPGSADTYAIAISAGGDLRLLAEGEQHSASLETAKARRALTCSGVLRMGAVEIGCLCSAAPLAAGTARWQLARVSGL
jgi:hypothetical protein